MCSPRARPRVSTSAIDSTRRAPNRARTWPAPARARGCSPRVRDVHTVVSLSNRPPSCRPTSALCEQSSIAEIAPSGLSNISRSVYRLEFDQAWQHSEMYGAYSNMRGYTRGKANAVGREQRPSITPPVSTLVAPALHLALSVKTPDCLTPPRSLTEPLSLFEARPLIVPSSCAERPIVVGKDCGDTGTVELKRSVGPNETTGCAGCGDARISWSEVWGIPKASSVTEGTDTDIGVKWSRVIVTGGFVRSSRMMRRMGVPAGESAENQSVQRMRTEKIACRIGLGGMTLASSVKMVWHLYCVKCWARLFARAERRRRNVPTSTWETDSSGIVRR